jgi:hypothetical protein
MLMVDQEKRAIVELKKKEKRRKSTRVFATRVVFVVVGVLDVTKKSSPLVPICRSFITHKNSERSALQLPKVSCRQKSCVQATNIKSRLPNLQNSCNHPNACLVRKKTHTRSEVL